MSCSKGDLKIEAARIGIKVHDLAREIKIRAFFGAHGLRFDLLDGNAAAGYDGFGDGAESRNGNGKGFDERRHASAFFRGYGIDLFIGRDSRQLDEGLSQLGGQKRVKGVDEIAIFIFLEIGEQAFIQRLHIQSGLQVDGKLIAMFFHRAQMRRSRKDHRTADTEMAEEHFSEILVDHFLFDGVRNADGNVFERKTHGCGADLAV